MCRLSLYVPFDLCGVRGLWKARSRIVDYMREQVAKHRATFDPHNLRDYIDAFLLEMMQRKRRASVSDCVKSNSTSSASCSNSGSNSELLGDPSRLSEAKGADLAAFDGTDTDMTHLSAAEADGHSFFGTLDILKFLEIEAAAVLVTYLRKTHINRSFSTACVCFCAM